MGYDRLKRLTLEQLMVLATRTSDKADRLMNQPHMRGSLSFGWDWPTFGVLWPRRMATKRAIFAEGRGRLAMNKKVG